VARPKHNLPASARRMQIIDRERRTARGIFVFSGADRPLTFTTCGASPGSIPFTIEPGVNEIHDMFGVPRKVAVQMRKERRFDERDIDRAPKTELIVSAMDIASHAETKLSTRGVVILTGTDTKEDEKRKRIAVKTWIAARVAEEREVIDNYHTKVRRFRADVRNAGKDDPLMNDREIEAESWLSKHDIGQLEHVKTLRCRFKPCGFHTENQDDMASHLEARHRDQILSEARAAAASRKRGGGETDPDSKATDPAAAPAS
jgi:hypothetical protein